MDSKPKPDEKDLAKLKALEGKRAALEAQVQKQRATIQEKARLRKNKTFFKIGKLADLAGLSGEDHAFLMGAFLEIAERKGDKQTHSKLKRRGAAALKRSQKQTTKA